jgi:hypothetical protein
MGCLLCRDPVWSLKSSPTSAAGQTRSRLYKHTGNSPAFSGSNGPSGSRTLVCRRWTRPPPTVWRRHGARAGGRIQTGATASRARPRASLRATRWASVRNHARGREECARQLRPFAEWRVRRQYAIRAARGCGFERWLAEARRRAREAVAVRLQRRRLGSLPGRGAAERAAWWCLLDKSAKALTATVSGTTADRRNPQ